MRIVAHHPAMLLPTLLLLTVQPSWTQRPPPNYSPDALPDTSFSCRGRQSGGYYADVEAGCQMFHVCSSSQGPSFRFLCPNDTVFDQQNLICANWFQVVCELDSVLHARNFEIFKTNSNKEASFNALYEDDLPELDDYEYETGLSAGQSFDSAPRFSSQRATTTSSAVGQFDQFIAASTARPVIVTAPNAVRWRGSTITGSSTTEPARFLPRQNSLDRGAGKLLTSDRPKEARRRLISPVSETVERSSQVSDSLNSQPLQEQERSAGTPGQTSGNVAQDSASNGSQSFRRTSGRVPPTSAPAESQNIERTSSRFNSISSSSSNRQVGERPTSSRFTQKISDRKTLTAAISVVEDSPPSSPAANTAPTAAALTSDAVTTPQSQLFNNARPAKTTSPTRSRASSSAARRQSQSASRAQSQSASRAQSQSASRAQSQSASRTQSQSASRAQSQSASRAQSQSASRTQSQSASRAQSQSTSQAQSQSASRAQSQSIAKRPSASKRLNDINTNELPTTGPAKDSQGTAGRPAPTSTPPSPVRVTFSSPLEPESRPFQLGSRVTTTEPVPPLNPVARSFFGPNVLPEVTARTVQRFGGSSGEVRQSTAVAAGGRPETQAEDDVAVTTFRPPLSTTLSPPTTTTTAREVNIEGNTESSTDGEIEIITETTTRARPQQSSVTTAATARRRGSRRRGGFARRGSSNARLARPRTTAATPGRARAAPTARPAASRSDTVVAARSRSSVGRRGRGGGRVSPAGAAVKPAQRRRQKVSRVNGNARGLQQNNVGVDLPGAKLSGKKEDVLARSTTETSIADADLTTADSISRPAGARSQTIQQTQKKSEDAPATTESSQQSVTTTQATTTTEVAASTPIVIRRRIRVRGRPSRRPNRRPSRRRATASTTPSPVSPPAPPRALPSPVPSPSPARAQASSAPSPAALLLPTNKEAAPGGSRLLRRPKLQLSSALPGVGRSRRLQQNTAAREARSGATRLVAPSGRQYGRRPAAPAPAPAPAAAGWVPSVQVSQRRRAGSLLSDYDYEYYDDENDVLFRKLAEANELVLDGLTRVRRQN